MANGYVRQSAGAITPGGNIRASHHNAEYDALAGAFDATQGHNHDGTAGGGAPIPPVGLVGLALTSAIGFVVNTDGSNFINRTIEGTANEIAVTNGDAVAGNPVLSLPSALTFTGKTVTGGTFDQASLTNLTGITMAGALDMGGNAIQNAGTGSFDGSIDLDDIGNASKWTLSVGSGALSFVSTGGAGTPVTFDASGDVGIGTSNPSAGLDVQQGKGFRVLSSAWTNPTGGTGYEIAYRDGSNVGETAGTYLLSYDRDNSLYKPVFNYGSEFQYTIDGTLTAAVTSAGVLTNTIEELTVDSGVTIDGLLIKDGTLHEVAADAGITIDGLLVKDGSAAQAHKLTTARTLSLSGDASGTVSFDGSADVDITVSVADDSHNHTIANVDGLQTALDAKVAKTGGTLSGSLTPDANSAYDLGSAANKWNIVYEDTPAWRFTRAGSGNVTIPVGAWTAVNMNDTSSGSFKVGGVSWNSAGSEAIVPVSGYYFCTASVSYNDVDVNYAGAGVARNGAVVTAHHNTNSPEKAPTAACNALVYASAGDTLEALFYHLSSADKDIRDPELQTFFSGVLVRAG